MTKTRYRFCLLTVLVFVVTAVMIYYFSFSNTEAVITEGTLVKNFIESLSNIREMDLRLWT